MPDYSGYAQRPQQDPNLAAWAQIGGNIANIFGLDPAKAAEARRGLQQEDYNEQRNQAYIRQQLANKRIGELFAGPGFDPARSEFTDPAAWQEFARLMGELGSGHQAPAYGPGHLQSQLDAKIAAEDRVLAARNKRDAERFTREKEEKDASDREKENTKGERSWRDVDKTGSSLIRVSPYAGATRFYRLLTEGGNGGAVLPYDQSGGFSRVTDETRGLPADKQKRKPSEAFSTWLAKSGFGSKAIPVEIEEKMQASGTNLDDERKSIAAELIRKFGTQLSEDDIKDITDRIVASELTTLHQKHKATKDPVIRVTGPDELQKVLLEQVALPPEQRSKSVLYRERIKGKLAEKYNYRQFTIQDLLDLRDDPDHPLFGK